MATPEFSQLSNDAMVNGTTAEDINMSENTVQQEAIPEDAPTTPIPIDVPPPIASPIQSPVTPDERAGSHGHNDIEANAASISNIPNTAAAQDLSMQQTIESGNEIYRAQAQAQAQAQTQMQESAQSQPPIEPLRQPPPSEQSSTVIPEPAPTQTPGAPTVAGSRTSAVPQPLETVAVQMANNEQGSAARIYINSRVTPVLLEGMKWVAKNEPERPLKWLSEYLAKRSADIEGP